MQYIYIYNGVLFRRKKKEILSFAKTWMDLEDIMLNDEGGNIGRYCLREQTCNKSINKSWRSNTQCNHYRQQCSIINFKVAKETRS